MGSSQRFAFLSAAWASRVFFRFVDILTHCTPLSWKWIDNVSFGCNPCYCSPMIPKDQLLWDFACGFGRWKIEANREEQSRVLPRVSSESMYHHLAEGPALELWYKENICCSPWCGSLNIFFPSVYSVPQETEPVQKCKCSSSLTLALNSLVFSLGT